MKPEEQRAELQGRRNNAGSSAGQWCTESPEDLDLFEGCWGIWTHILKRSCFSNTKQKHASPVKGRSKSSLMHSDGEIRKKMCIKASGQTVQVKKYDVPHILLIIYYLADYTIFDTDAWKASCCLTVLCSKMLYCVNALHWHYNTEFVGEYLPSLQSLCHFSKRKRRNCDFSPPSFPWLHAPSPDCCSLRTLLLPGFFSQLALPSVAQRLQRGWREHTENCSRGNKAAVGGGKVTIFHRQGKRLCWQWRVEGHVGRGKG